MHRLFVEKRPPHNLQASAILEDLRESGALPNVTGVRLIQRYDVEGISEEEFIAATRGILSEPQVDETFFELVLTGGEQAFAVEYLPGQFDQRADSAAQCIQIQTGKARPRVWSAQIFVLQGNLAPAEVAVAKRHLINTVDSHEIPLHGMPADTPPATPAQVAVLDGFTRAPAAEIRTGHGLAMSLEDVAFVQDYFRERERREPTLTELRVLDTYWSDHCRHTTFHTQLTEVEFEDPAGPSARAWRAYQEARAALGRTTKPATLMDLALTAMRELRAAGRLENLEESQEINAASIVVPVSIDGGPEEEWLVMFKNETHNHPTEIEPFGGAATCLGGCIRDPLSGRSYVYQAMRVTGAGNPLTPISETLPGKLPQRKICQIAAAGYASYGNQIGLATGQVSEVYHPGYVAKRMEIGAVVAAAPRANVFRGTPAPGDAILLIGGRTGRDGIGGATGSSKEHTSEALQQSAEVQKGDAPTERKIQRLFRLPELARKIKLCNDFGAGGVSVAIGEMAPSLRIDLDAVPKKYEGLDGTELAISESQERMAVCVDPADVEFFAAAADRENLECTQVAEVTSTGRLVMVWRGQTVVDLAREFLDSNGVQQTARVRVAAAKYPLDPAREQGETLWPWGRMLSPAALLGMASQRGLGERFDSSVGASTVLWPFGGKYQITPPDAMVAKLPLLAGDTDTCTYMAWGFDPEISSNSPFHGAVYALTESVCKAVAAGARLDDIRLTLQEYFPRLGEDPARWGLPLAALLGAFHAQRELGLAAIGGKDSMSGSFHELDVPPTLVSFALAPGRASLALSPEFKGTNSLLSLVQVPLDSEQLPDFARLRSVADTLHQLNKRGCLLSLHHIGARGLGGALAICAFGNGIGALISTDLPLGEKAYFSFLLEHETELPAELGARTLGRTTGEPVLVLNGTSYPLEELRETWEAPLEPIYPTRPSTPPFPLAPEVPLHNAQARPKAPAITGKARPKVVIPALPGINSEYDSAKAFHEAGGEAEIVVFRNLTAAHIRESLDELAAKIRQAHIFMLPGGFSAGDEPDGSAKFTATVLRSHPVADAVMDLVRHRNGLILGICNGFQALIKTGLLPYGEFRPPTADSPTLAGNQIARHQSRYVTTRVTSNLSPWFAACQPGEIHRLPLSHGEGRFWATPESISTLAAAGQIATQYCDLEGRPSMDIQYNPNGSLAAVEAITSPDGRILGKMAHSERRGVHVAKNIPGPKEQPLFRSGVSYFL